GAVLHYLKDTEHPQLQHITSIQRIDREDYLWMDKFTIRNLELMGGPVSLLGVLDNTVSPMGARLLKRWMLMPLKDARQIRQRLDAVEFFIKDPGLRSTLSQHIQACGDIERLVSRIPSRKIGPRECWQLARGLEHIAQIKEAAKAFPEDWLGQSAERLDPCPAVLEKIGSTLKENPPAAAGKGDTIRRGVNADLDDLRDIATGGKEYLARLQQQEAERSGITSLKIG